MILRLPCGVPQDIIWVFCITLVNFRAIFCCYCCFFSSNLTYVGEFEHTHTIQLNLLFFLIRSSKKKVAINLFKHSLEVSSVAEVIVIS